MAAAANVRSTLALICLATAAAVVAGFVYERVERRHDRQRLPQIGRSIDIGGRSINLFCSGEGSPTVVLDSSPPRSGYSWLRVEREIASFTRACWYDRAGYGWSDPGPDPRDARAAAQDLHEVLRRSGTKGPYVLVGELFAGFEIRVYYGLYRDEVAGVLLIDPVPDDEVSNPRRRGLMPHFLHYPQNVFAQVLNQLGLIRLLDLGAPRNAGQRRPAGFASEEWKRIQDLREQPKTRSALLQEMVFESIQEARGAGSFGDRPFVVLTPSGSDVDTSEFRPLLRLSTRTRHEVVDGGSAIVYNSPEAVVSAIREVVREVHKGNSQR